MADIRFNNQYCIVKDKDEIIISAFLNARVETPHEISCYDNIKDIPVKDLPDLPEIGEIIEKDKVYKHDNKAMHCKKEHKREEKINNAFFKTKDEKPVNDMPKHDSLKMGKTE